MGSLLKHWKLRKDKSKVQKGKKEKRTYVRERM